MGILSGMVTRVDARTGRRTSNALTLTFKAAADTTLAVATQAGGLGVLLGFKNGGAGRFRLAGGGGQLTIDAAGPRTRVTNEAGAAIGSIEPGAAAARILDAGGAALATLTGQPTAARHESAWSFPIADATGTPLGTITLLRAGYDFAADLVDAVIWGAHAGNALRVPTLGVRLELNGPVAEPLGDLLLCACVDLALGPRAFLAP